MPDHRKARSTKHDRDEPKLWSFIAQNHLGNDFCSHIHTNYSKQNVIRQNCGSEIAQEVTVDKEKFTQIVFVIKSSSNFKQLTENQSLRVKRLFFISLTSNLTWKLYDFAGVFHANLSNFCFIWFANDCECYRLGVRWLQTVVSCETATISLQFQHFREFLLIPRHCRRDRCKATTEIFVLSLPNCILRNIFPIQRFPEMLSCTERFSSFIVAFVFVSRTWNSFVGSWNANKSESLNAWEFLISFPWIFDNPRFIRRYWVSTFIFINWPHFT